MALVFPPPQKKDPYKKDRRLDDEQVLEFHQPVLLPTEELLGSLLVFTYEEEEEEVPAILLLAASEEKKAETLAIAGGANSTAEQPEKEDRGGAVAPKEPPLDIDKILKYAFIDLDAPPDREKHSPVEVERRYVYADEAHYRDKPYYYSHTHNCVLVVDKRRIEYFPEKGVVPVELRGKIKDYHYTEPLGIESETPETEEEKEVLQKVGFTIVQVPEKVEEEEDESGRPIKRSHPDKKFIFRKERRPVYVVVEKSALVAEGSGEAAPASPADDAAEPVYFFFSGKNQRRMVAPPSTIRFLLPDGSEPEEDEAADAHCWYRAVVQYYANEEEEELGKAIAVEAQEEQKRE